MYNELNDVYREKGSGTCLGMYVLYMINTTKQGLCADSTGEFTGTTGQEVSKWGSLGITG